MRQRRRKPMKCRTGKIRNAYEKMKDKKNNEKESPLKKLLPLGKGK